MSIITIFRDAERFLPEAIDSVFAQTFAGWELLLVDDGSVDGSSEIARTVARRDRRVRYLEHPDHANLGMSATRNFGIAHAIGRYIAFLDADDVWLPRRLEAHLAVLEAQPEAAMVYGRSQYWYSWSGDPKAPRDFVHELGVPPRSLIRPPTLIRRFFAAQDAAIPESVLVRREAIDKVGGFEPLFRGPYEDQAFFAKICLRFPVIAVDDCLDRYRQHRDSSSSRDAAQGRALAARARFLDWLVRYLQGHGVEDQGMLRELRFQAWSCRHPRLMDLVGRVGRAGFAIARRILPLGVRRRLGAPLPALAGGRSVSHGGSVRLGDLRRVTPISREFGFDRGLPIDRYYIERFLAANDSDIQGRVLEVADAGYTERFGGGRVTVSDVLDTSADNPRATIVADLTDGTSIASGAFDCVILTQTLQFVYDVHAAVRTVHQILRPGGVLLATVPGITPISRYEADRWGHYWNLTHQSADRLFGDVFGPGEVSIEAHGNVLAAIAFLEGLASEGFTRAELDAVDADFPVILSIRATKPPAETPGR